MVLVLCEMQSVSSRFWTRVAVYNSYDDNHYFAHMMDDQQSHAWSPYFPGLTDLAIYKNSHPA